MILVKRYAENYDSRGVTGYNILPYYKKHNTTNIMRKNHAKN